jgi:hypothetical protein
MSSSGKTITINPIHFQNGGGSGSGGGGKTRKKSNKEIKVKNSTVKNNNTKHVKKLLLEKLKREQQKNLDILFQKPNTLNDSIVQPKPANDFEQSVEFLTTLEKAAPKNYTFKNANPHPPIEKNTSFMKNYLVSEENLPIETNGNNIVLKKQEEPQWGCLKNGKLQTYRAWKKQTPITFTPTILVSGSGSGSGSGSSPTNSFLQTTTQSTQPIQTTTQSTQPIQSTMPQQTITPTISEEQKEKIKRMSEMKQMIEKQQQIKKKSMKRKKTIRRTFYTGKSKTSPIISVLVSNKTIRKNITTKANQLKQKPITEIRSFLIKKGLIKVGSSAPNDVLRKMYESVILTGDITNHNPENLLYNYLHQ